MKPVTALIILDGYGCSSETAGNAILADGSRNITALSHKYPATTLGASGLDVGLPNGQMGNSEVGHLNIGAGRIVYQELTRISKAIADGEFFKNPALNNAMLNCKNKGTALHLMGLCSNGGVHSHLEHLYAILRLALSHGLKNVFIHCFMDGRDVPPHSGKGFLEEVEAECAKIGCGKIATVMGRYYAMDRDSRYERTEKAYAALVYGEGVQAESAAKLIDASYQNSVSDEFVVPGVIFKAGRPLATLKPDDSVVFFNFRPDRARQLTAALIYKDYDGFVRRNGCFPLFYVSLTQYDKGFMPYLKVAFLPVPLDNTLGEYLSANGMTQLRIAETEKYAHVTFFFNGGVETPSTGEDRCLIPSPKVATYDLKPEMSAYEVADEAVKRIKSGLYDVIILNFANADMVGHTGVMEAAQAAVHAVDACVGRVVQAVLSCGGRAIITADHGNAEKMLDPLTGGPFTAHSTNRVPCILVDPERINCSLRADGRLSDLAPTLLELINLPIPSQMSGKSLIICE